MICGNYFVLTKYSMFLRVSQLPSKFGWGHIILFWSIDCDLKLVCHFCAKVIKYIIVSILLQSAWRVYISYGLAALWKRDIPCTLGLYKQLINLYYVNCHNF